jgi:hypothetical protein
LAKIETAVIDRGGVDSSQLTLDAKGELQTVIASVLQIMACCTRYRAIGGEYGIEEEFFS